ncbi:MAG: adenosylcobinamide-phosphate synthase [Candidatus Binatota bacterium]|nr:adenosylcobinamide-phosphate synthase [Candidatus Binatota bacterium]
MIFPPPGWIVLSAVALDLLVGDPRWLPHPVRGIGLWIAAGERILWTGRRIPDLVGGAFLAISTVVAAAGIAAATLEIAAAAGPLVAATAALLIAWTTLAIRGLADTALAIASALDDHDLERARRLLPSLVGRDPEALGEDAAIRATIESVAENASDAVIAPLFYLVLLGPAGAVAYKAINTLDSMIGHQDERYRYFGRFAARLDDAANLLPARLTAILLAAAAGLCRGSGRAALRTTIEDGRKHASPNAGFPEAAMAGALGLRLGGPATYAGEVEDRPFWGSSDRVATAADIRDAVLLMRVVSALGLITLLSLRSLMSSVRS